MDVTKINSQVLADEISLKTLVTVASKNHGIKAPAILNILRDHSMKPDSVLRLYYIPEMDSEHWHNNAIEETERRRRVKLYALKDGCGCLFKCEIEEMSKNFDFYPVLKTSGEFMEFLFVSSAAYYDITGEKPPKSFKHPKTIKLERRRYFEGRLNGQGYNKGDTIPMTRAQVWTALKQADPELFSAGEDDFFKDNSDLATFRTGRPKSVESAPS